MKTHCKTHFFHLFSLPLLLSNLITFLFLIHFEQFKMLYECHLNSYKSSWNSNSNRAIYKQLFGCSRTGWFGTLIATEQYTSNFSGVWVLAFVVFDGLFFLDINLFYFGGHNFLISNPFSTIVNVSDVSRGGVQILFAHQKQWNAHTKNSKKIPHIPVLITRNWNILYPKHFLFVQK